MSLLGIIEERLRQLSGKGETPSFSSRWRGQFEPAHHDDTRFEALARQYL
jgi:hypothetical protein